MVRSYRIGAGGVVNFIELPGFRGIRLTSTFKVNRRDFRLQLPGRLDHGRAEGVALRASVREGSALSPRGRSSEGLSRDLHAPRSERRSLVLSPHPLPSSSFPPGRGLAIIPRMNWLHYGDNLEVLRRYIKDETVDLVYLDRAGGAGTNRTRGTAARPPSDNCAMNYCGGIISRCVRVNRESAGTARATRPPEDRRGERFWQMPSLRCQL